MSRRHWKHIEKWENIEAIISGQMGTYILEGKAQKACALLARIRVITRRPCISR